MDWIIVSDIHGQYDRLDRVLAQQLKRPDGLIFLGDGLRDMQKIREEWQTLPVLSVCGNCDFFGWLDDGDNPKERVEVLGGIRLFMTHGDRYGVKSGYGAAIKQALRFDADILLCGHTHIFHDEWILEGPSIKKPLHVFNPGSLGYPDDGVPSFGCLHIQNGQYLLSRGVLE